MNSPYADEGKGLPELLWDISTMQRDDDRELILQSLTAGRYEFAIPAASNGKLHCMKIVDVAAAHRGALQFLAEKLIFAEGSSMQAEMFAAKVRGLLPSDIFSLPERMQFIREMEPYISPDEFNTHYTAVTGYAPARGYADLSDMVSDLEQLISQEPCHPLILLTEAIAQERTVARNADKVHAWSDRLARNIDDRARNPAWDQERRKLTEFRRSKVKIPMHGSGRATLILQLEPYGPRPELYLLSAWLYLGKSFIDKIHGNDIPVSLDTVQATLIEAVDQAARRVDQRDSNATEMDLEFILPRNLLSFPFEEWTNRPFDYMSLDVQFVVVVRDLERLRDPALRFRWRRKWAYMMANDYGPELSRWITCADRPCAPGQVFRQLLPDSHVSLGLTFPPLPGAQGFEMAEVLNAGTPIAIWPRQPCQHAKTADAGSPDMCRGARFKEELCRRLDGQRLSDLPKLVLELRQEKPGLEEPEWSLVLLWDDPTRRPEPDNFTFDAPPSLEDLS